MRSLDTDQKGSCNPPDNIESSGEFITDVTFLLPQVQFETFLSPGSLLSAFTKVVSSKFLDNLHVSTYTYVSLLAAYISSLGLPRCPDISYSVKSKDVTFLLSQARFGARSACALSRDR